jgi:1-acyl-sn-glycerol-3-phosphate acyltransferase
MGGELMGRGGPGYSRAGRRATEIILPPLIRAVMKRDWHGHEHVPPSGGVILAPNHLSYADWAATALFSYEAGRYPAFLIKSGVFRVKVIGPMLYRLGQLPVNRGQADAALVLREAERSLAAGECLIVYPEGTATRDPDLWPMVARTGAARLALATGAPVIPVAHWGTQVILPYGSKRPKLLPRHTVRLQAGPPVDLSAFTGRPLDRATLRAATAAIMADITALLAGLRGEQPPAEPYDMAKARQQARPGAAGSLPEPAAAGHGSGRAGDSAGRAGDSAGRAGDSAGRAGDSAGEKAGGGHQEAAPA